MKASSYSLIALLALLFLASGAPKFVQGGGNAAPPRPSEETVLELFDEWNAALAVDAAAVAALYASDAILLPTLSNKIRATPQEIYNYFYDEFLPKQPHATLVVSYFYFPSGNIAIHNGKYNFDLTDPETGEQKVSKARFTYIWLRRNGAWKIVNHHSSPLPDTEEELFFE